MARDWTAEENEATVRSYLGMLQQELAHQPFVKARYRESLAQDINRSQTAIEYKYRNISAVLMAMHAPFIDGYKPAMNFQSSLAESVASVVLADHDVTEQMRAAMELPAAPRVDLQWSSSNGPDVRLDAVWNHEARTPVTGVDYVMVEGMNRRLGAAGELAILEFEDRRLRQAGQPRLAERIEHVSVVRGDGLGYDIASFEADGSPRLIEVKTTRRGINWPMFISRNEVERSRELAEHYHLYRVYNFSKPQPGLYQLKGALADTCDLDPQSYAGLPKVA